MQKNIDYRGVFNLVHEAIFVFDSENYRLIDVNDTCCQMFHCKRDNIILGDPSQFCSNVIPFTPSSLKVWLDKARKSGPQVFEWHSRTLDGELFWVEVTLKVADLVTGRVIIAVVRDIENRKKLMDKLLLSEVRYRTLVESSPFGYVIHQDGKIVYINNTGIKMIGARTVTELIGRDVLDFIHPDYHKIAIARIKEVIVKKKAVEVSEQVYLRIDGSERIVRVMSLPIEHEGKPAVQTIIQDITEEKDTKRELTTSESRFQQIFVYSMDAIGMVHDNTIIMVNDAYVKIFGYESEFELIGNPTDAFIAPQAREDLQIRRRNRNSDGFIQNRYRTKGLKKNGEEFDLEVSVSFYDDHNEQYMVAILRDITVELQRQKKLANHMFYLNSMHRLSLVIEQYSADTHSMIDNVLSEIINIFDIDRAFLLFRFDDEPDRIHVPFSRVVLAEYDISGDEIPDENFALSVFNKSLDEHGYIELSRDSVEVTLHDYFDRLKIKSSLFFVIDPKVEHKWILGMHQCSRARIWTDEEKELLQDISSRMAQVLRNLIMQDRVLHSDKQYQKLFQTIQDVYIRTDLDGNIQLVSPSYENLTGYSLQEAGQMNLKVDLFVFREEFDKARKVVIECGIIEGLITRIYRNDKSISWIASNLQAVYDTDGTIVGLEGIIRDITREKEAELALAEEKERLATTLQSLGEGVIATNRSGEIMLINQAALEMTGITGKIIGSPFSEIVRCTAEEDHHKKVDPISEVLKNVVGKSSVIEISDYQTVCLLHQLDEIKTISLTASPLENNSGDCTGVVVVFRDMTDSRKLEHELQKRQKLESLGLMAGGIAHDFNNFLTGIMGNLELLRTLSGFEPHIQEMLEEVTSATFRASDLTQQLLTFSKGGEPIKKSGDIGKLIRSTVMFPLRGSNIKCELNMDDDVWPLEFDEAQINQAFNNIIINAKQAMPDGGIIRISLENIDLDEINSQSLKSGRYVKIMVKDEGAGIIEENMEKIFDPFFTTKEMGSGLGLATTYSIIKKHNGMIEINSEPGRGTEVIVYLPAADYHIVEPEKVADPIIKGSGSILLMDDEDMILSVGKKILTIVGYTVETAHHGDEAIELYKKSLAENRPFDVVILDITIPGGMGGAETLKRLQVLHSSVKAIVSSGYSTDPIMSDYLSYGFAGVVSKPYRMEDLFKTISQIING